MKNISPEENRSQKQWSYLSTPTYLYSAFMMFKYLLKLPNNTKKNPTMR